MARVAGGTLKAFTYDGIPYTLAGDANAVRKPAQEKEGMGDAGGVNTIKIIQGTGQIESIKLRLTLAEYDVLAAKEGFLSTSLTYPNGEVLMGPSELGLGDFESEESSVEVICIPETADGWSLL